MPPSLFCNASIPERLRESYYQHHQGMIDKRSESNISTYESKKAAVRSHIGSRTAACLLIFYSFLSLGVRTTPDHKSGRAHLQNVASRWAKLKFLKIEFLQLFHSKSGALYVKTPHFRAAFSALHLSSTHFGAGGVTRTHDLLITNQLLYRLSYTSIFLTACTFYHMSPGMSTKKFDDYYLFSCMKKCCIPAQIVDFLRFMSVVQNLH